MNKSSYYYQPTQISAETLELLRLIDKIYTDYPTFGTRSMCSYLENEHSHELSRDRMRNLYNRLQIRAIYQEPKTTISNPMHKKYPYLLRDVEIVRVNQVWSTDITYIPMKKGFIYLSAIGYSQKNEQRFSSRERSFSCGVNSNSHFVNTHSHHREQLLFYRAYY